MWRRYKTEGKQQCGRRFNSVEEIQAESQDALNAQGRWNRYINIKDDHFEKNNKSLKYLYF